MANTTESRLVFIGEIDVAVSPIFLQASAPLSLADAHALRLVNNVNSTPPRHHNKFFVPTPLGDASHQPSFKTATAS